MTHALTGTANLFSYAIAGLELQSEIPLPELTPGAGSAPHAVIRTGIIEEPSGLARIAPGWSADSDSVFFEIANVGRFLVRIGNDIIIDPDPAASPSRIRLFLLGSALGALYHQRGLLPLHAGAWSTAHGCYAITGQSGAGKSTTVAFLNRRGYRSLTDDVLAVQTDQTPPLALPGYPQTKIWQDTATALSLDTSQSERVDAQRDKYYIPIDPQQAFTHQAHPLRRLYILEDATHPGEARITRLNHGEALAELTRNTYRPFLLEPMGRWTAHFKTCANLLQHIKVYRLTRPRDLTTIASTIDILEAHFDQP